MISVISRTSVFVLLWALVIGQIPEPQNVQIDFVDSKRILKWDSVFYQGNLVTYSVQRTFESNDNRSWLDVHDCMLTTETRCKLLNDVNATCNLRVRAEHGNETSNWVEAVAEPKNVTVDSLNKKHVVKWDPDVYQLGSVTYSVQYQGNYERLYNESWSEVPKCTRITETDCDLSDSLAFFAKYFLRVRAELGSATSPWVEIPAFYPYKNTVFGPPSVEVLPKAGSLHVDIKGPFTENEHPLSNDYEDFAYQIFYWKENEDGNIKMVNKSAPASAVLHNLQPWTRYCLKARAYSKANSKQGQFSPVICEDVNADTKRRALAMAQILFVTLLAVLVVTLGCFFFVIYARKAIKYLMYPSYSLPVHIREYLTEPSQQPMLGTLTKEDLREEHWDKLSIVSQSEIPSILPNSTKTDGSKSNKNETISGGKILNEEDDVQSSQSSVDSGHYSNSTENSAHKTPQSLRRNT
ncbi:interleukin-10 receptor subunit beta-like [Hemiscyllium ocellatum]|uniref:interleukin-10 receptor subunit beta-like n=1 Tax=Hemiscyllium ocellatum TaxID=170820 RepID=UPI002966E425|nr:interleukin-10 receptor subunit beta-like [Hemiscyllium ocellatum]